MYNKQERINIINNIIKDYDFCIGIYDKNPFPYKNQTLVLKVKDYSNWSILLSVVNKINKHFIHYLNIEICTGTTNNDEECIDLELTFSEDLCNDYESR